MTLYFEDLVVGQRFVSHDLAIDAAMIKEYAAKYDPQPFHLDEAAAANSIFAGLAASGWHTASLTMRLLVDTLPFAGGFIGSGLDELRWPFPVRPGDRLHVEAEVTELRPSNSRPTQGWAKMTCTTLTDAGKAVLVIKPNLIVPRRA